ncbi:MAG: hypothetical protein EBS73_15950 [Betaproteobacteria bacterium]|nr:hypothetical protein [Betaproteobacteria bacterium]
MVRTAAQRWFPPSFDPPIPEPEPEIVWPTVEEIEAIREAARREGYEAGREEGFAKGVGEGFTQGYEQGLAEGREKAYEEHGASIVELTQTLQMYMAWSIAERLSLGEHIDRTPFLHAVEEALMRLPAPGENLLLRVPPAQRAIWDEFLAKASLPFRMDILADADQESGAYIEVEGTRIDVGPEARRALVLMAMGLLPRESSNTRDAADLAESS